MISVSCFIVGGVLSLWRSAPYISSENNKSWYPSFTTSYGVGGECAGGGGGG